jgi:hypothetical protein
VENGVEACEEWAGTGWGGAEDGTIPAFLRGWLHSKLIIMGKVEWAKHKSAVGN